MKILIVHNRYQQPGGEDGVVAAERELLQAAGHTVVEYTRSNDEIKQYGWGKKVGLAWRTVWARDSSRALRQLVEQEKAAVAHFHNTFPLVSPAGYAACREAGVPVVQTLHNYRLFCPSADFFRSGRVCEDCVEKSLWRGVRFGCYRDSRPATATVALMLAMHRARGTWVKEVDCFIVPTVFAQKKCVANGLPAEKVAVKPNFVYPDPGPREERGRFGAFVGRLAREKGLKTLLAAWRRLGERVPLRLYGDGPLRAELEVEAAHVPGGGISFHGSVPRPQVLEALKQARCLIFPSQTYEVFPLAIVEAFACGLPVVASRLGAMAELVADGQTGLHFTPGDPKDLADKVEWLWGHPEKAEEMGRAARAEYEAKYTSERNYALLMDIYRRVSLPATSAAARRR